MNKKVIAFTLIIAILINFTYVKNESYGAVPVAPVVYYAIAGAMMVAGLLADDDSYTFLYSLPVDYYNKATTSIKQQWQTIAASAYTGYLVISNNLIQDVITYIMNLDDIEVSFNPEMYADTGVPRGLSITQIGDIVLYPIYNNTVEGSIKRFFEGINFGGYDFVYKDISSGDVVGISSLIYSHQSNAANPADVRHAIIDFGFYTVPYITNQQLLYLYYTIDYSLVPELTSNDVTTHTKCVLNGNNPLPYPFSPIIAYIPSGYEMFDIIFANFWEMGMLYESHYVEQDKELVIPVPPLPVEEWGTDWIDTLERELNDLSSTEDVIEHFDTDYDWYVDKDGNIYRRTKGEPPKEDDDTKLIPGPPPFDPNDPNLDPDPIEPVEPCPYCPPNPWTPTSPDNPPCPNPYCPNQPNPIVPPTPDPLNPSEPVEPCPYCPPNPWTPTSPDNPPCPNPYCPNQPDPVVPPTPNTPTSPSENKIDWSPILELPQLFTQKFPFSLPWDLKRAFENLYGEGWDAKIPIEFTYNVLGANWVVNEVIDLTPYNNIVKVFKTFIILAFDVGLIMFTRRLMGGDV